MRRGTDTGPRSLLTRWKLSHGDPEDEDEAEAREDVEEEQCLEDDLARLDTPEETTRLPATRSTTLKVAFPSLNMFLPNMYKA